jgi:hypothetical protein
MPKCFDCRFLAEVQAFYRCMASSGPGPARSKLMAGREVLVDLPCDLFQPRISARPSREGAAAK